MTRFAQIAGEVYWTSGDTSRRLTARDQDIIQGVLLEGRTRAGCKLYWSLIDAQIAAKAWRRASSQLQSERAA